MEKNDDAITFISKYLYYELKMSMEFTQNDLEERVNNVEENTCKVKED